MSQISRKPRQQQIDQSRSWIAEAYILLLTEQSSVPENISMSKIAVKAGVSRQTVYRHFSTREEILDWFIESQFTSFMKASEQVSAGSSFHYENLRLVFRFFEIHASLIKILISQNREYIILRKMEDLTNRLSPKIFTDCGAIERIYREKYFAGGLFMIASGWIERGCIDDQEVIFRIAESSLLSSNKIS